MLNYHYDMDQGVYELYYGDTLLVELLYADPMTDKQAEDLAQELFDKYMEVKSA